MQSCCSSGSVLEIQVKQNAICSFASNRPCGDVALIYIALSKNSLSVNADALAISVTFAGQRFFARKLSFARLVAIANIQVLRPDASLNVAIFSAAFK